MNGNQHEASTNHGQSAAMEKCKKIHEEMHKDYCLLCSGTSILCPVKNERGEYAKLLSPDGKWESQKFDPHCSHIFQPIYLKLKTKNDIRVTTAHAKFGLCGMTGRGSAKMANFGLLLVLFFVLFALRPDHTVGPITTNEGLKCVFLCKEVPFGVLMIKSKV